MSTPEQPDTPPLTRKQLRDLRNTGVTPVITPETLAPAPVAAAPAEEAPPAPPVPAPVPLPRAAAPVVVPEAPVADASVDLGVSPLTRRQARQQERIRTASVPVITPEVAAAHAAAMAASAPAVVEEPAEAPEADEYSGGETPTEAMRDLFGIAAEEPALEPDQSEPEAEVVEPLVELVEAEPETVDVVEVVEVEPAADESAADESAADESAAVESDDLQAALGLSAEEPETEPQTAEEPDAESDRPVLNPLFGSAFVASEPESVELPASFDDLLARGTTGSTAPPSALILTQSTGGSPIVAPVTATGEMLVTGTLNLPEGLGSIGHAPGAADGKEVDAVLVDGELPAHSSPTPIAASAAISTVKTNGDVIKPPAPEKGSRLMMSLAITAGVLALALVGVLILAFVNGVF